MEIKEDRVLASWETFCATCKTIVAMNHTHCPECNSAPSNHRLENYSAMWHEGDVYCNQCNSFVRDWDAG